MLETSEETQIDWEACLSVPNWEVQKRRKEWILMQY